METIEKSEYLLLQSYYEYALRRWKWSADRIKDLEAKLGETEEELNNAYECIDDLFNKIDAIKDLLF